MNREELYIINIKVGRGLVIYFIAKFTSKNSMLKGYFQSLLFIFRSSNFATTISKIVYLLAIFLSHFFFLVIKNLLQIDLKTLIDTRPNRSESLISNFNLKNGTFE